MARVLGPHPQLGRLRCLRCRTGALVFDAGPSLGTPEPIPPGLTCTACGNRWPVVAGIPRFVLASNYADSFGFQWDRHRRTQLDSYTGHSISRERVTCTTGWPDALTGETILEAGSGAGRFTEILLASGATVCSFDYSSAVEANALNNGEHPGLLLFQGDIMDIPVRELAFDKVVCLGVLQHTPDPERAFRSLTRHVRPGGQLVVDVYARRLTALVSWKYLLRPLSRRMEARKLYRLTERAVDVLLPAAVALRRVVGRVGARLLPILEYSNLGLDPALNREWAVLDTFDMYSPAHDHPRSLAAVAGWFREAGFEDIVVRKGQNGVVGRGRRPMRDTGSESGRSGAGSPTP